MKWTEPSAKRKFVPPECLLPNAPFVTPSTKSPVPGGVLSGLAVVRKVDDQRRFTDQALKQPAAPLLVPLGKTPSLASVSPTAIVWLVPSRMSLIPLGPLTQ